MKTSPAYRAPVVGAITGVLLGLMLFPFGVILLFIPVAGWVLGPVFMLMAITMPIVALGSWTGTCPVCGEPIQMVSDSMMCPRCKSRVVRQGSRFVVY